MMWHSFFNDHINYLLRILTSIINQTELTDLICIGRHVFNYTNICQIGLKKQFLLNQEI